MATSGYSGTPLIKKLGILDTSKILLINPPKDYFELLEKDVKKLLARKGDAINLVHLFVTSNKQFESEMTKLSPLCKANPSIVIWVSWYKKAAGIPTDITEDTIRNFALAHDLVDVKVCAVSEIWSGLKLVVPRSKR